MAETLEVITAVVVEGKQVVVKVKACPTDAVGIPALDPEQIGGNIGQ